MADSGPTPAPGLGQAGEDLAAAHLEAKGYRVLERNYRFNREEVDLVCFHPYADYTQGGELVFVEVKARRGEGFGAPEEAVDRAKQRAVMRVAEAYLHERRLEGSPVRFDVVAVRVPPQGEPEITHHENAFGYFV
ncbi:MAG: YraN family protein [Rubricoccaceae bacterium]